MCFDAKRKGDCLESLNKDGRVEVLLNSGLIYEGEHKLEFVFIYLFIRMIIFALDLLSTDHEQ